MKKEKCVQSQATTVHVRDMVFLPTFEHHGKWQVIQFSHSQCQEVRASMKKVMSAIDWGGSAVAMRAQACYFEDATKKGSRPMHKLLSADTTHSWSDQSCERCLDLCSSLPLSEYSNPRHGETQLSQTAWARAIHAEESLAVARCAYPHSTHCASQDACPRRER